MRWVMKMLGRSLDQFNVMWPLEGASARGGFVPEGLPQAALVGQGVAPFPNLPFVCGVRRKRQIREGEGAGKKEMRERGSKKKKNRVKER